MVYIATIAGKEYRIEILDERHIRLNGELYEVDIESVGDQPIFSLLVNNKSYEVHVYPSEEEWQVLLHGSLYPAKVQDEREKKLRATLGSNVIEHGEFHLKAPMPGLIVSVPVVEGQEVQKGDVLLVLESMKMQNELKSPKTGKVTRIRVKAGDNVEQKQSLLAVI